MPVYRREGRGRPGNLGFPAEKERVEFLCERARTLPGECHGKEGSKGE